jgi:hypothetical protein
LQCIEHRQKCGYFEREEFQETFMRCYFLLTIAVLVAGCPANAESLKPATAAAFDHHLHLSEQRMDDELTSGPFLWPDGLQTAQHKEAFERLKRGEVVTQKLETLDRGTPLPVPGGLIHHWQGIVFVAGASLTQTLALLQNYNEHSRIYAPHVLGSRLIQHSGDDFKVFLRLREQKVVTVVLDSEYDVHYFLLDATRAGSRSYSTRVAEIENPGQPDEHEKSAGDDSGYLWRLNSYWRFWERDGGVYIQLEAISLTRDIPAGLAWLIRPFITSIPEESLRFTLNRTQATLGEKHLASDKY